MQKLRKELDGAFRWAFATRDKWPSDTSSPLIVDYKARLQYFPTEKDTALQQN